MGQAAAEKLQLRCKHGAVRFADNCRSTRVRTVCDIISSPSWTGSNGSG